MGSSFTREDQHRFDEQMDAELRLLSLSPAHSLREAYRLGYARAVADAADAPGPARCVDVGDSGKAPVPP